MNSKLNKINTLTSQIGSTGFCDINYTDLDILAILVLRYLLDIPNDIVNLQKDIADLSYFPERLTASYRDEWIKYIKKAIAQLKLKELNKSALGHIVDDKNTDTLTIEIPIRKRLDNLKTRLDNAKSDDYFSKMYAQVTLADKVISSDDILVLKSEQLRRIEQLIK